TEHPQPPTRLKIVDKCSRSVDLSWTPPHDGNSPITRYIIEYKPSKLNWYQDGERILVHGNQNIAAIFDLRPATIYHLRIVAINEMGESVPSDTVTVITSQEVPDSPTSVKALVTSAESILLSWLPPDRPNGIITQYTVYYKVHGKQDS
ncbi:unnamed protein product, partial [Meganyctiphanes norvegica]